MTLTIVVVFEVVVLVGIELPQLSTKDYLIMSVYYLCMQTETYTTGNTLCKLGQVHYSNIDHEESIKITLHRNNSSLD